MMINYLHVQCLSRCGPVCLLTAPPGSGTDDGDGDEGE